MWQAWVSKESPVEMMDFRKYFCLENIDAMW